MKKIFLLIITASLLLSAVSCKKDGIPEIEYSESIRIFSGSMGRSVNINDCETIKRLTDEINSLEVTNGRRDNTDGFTFEISWQNGDGERIESVRIYGEGEIGYGKNIYQADCRGLIEILAGVPMPL